MKTVILQTMIEGGVAQYEDDVADYEGMTVAQIAKSMYQKYQPKETGTWIIIFQETATDQGETRIFTTQELAGVGYSGV